MLNKLFAGVVISLVFFTSGCSNSTSLQGTDQNSAGNVASDSSPSSEDDTKSSVIAVLKNSCTDLSGYAADAKNWEEKSNSSVPVDLVLYGDGGTIELFADGGEDGLMISIGDKSAQNFESSNWLLASSGCSNIDGLDLSVLSGSSDSGSATEVVEVPNLIGNSEKDAQNYLFTHQIGMPSVQYLGTDKSQDCMVNHWGLVTDINPAPGNFVEKSKAFTVTLYVDCQR